MLEFQVRGPTSGSHWPPRAGQKYTHMGSADISHPLTVMFSGRVLEDARDPRPPWHTGPGTQGTPWVPAPSLDAGLVCGQSLWASTRLFHAA